MSRPTDKGQTIQVWLPDDLRTRLDAVIHRLRMEAGPGSTVTVSGTLADVVRRWVEREERKAPRQ